MPGCLTNVSFCNLCTSSRYYQMHLYVGKRAQGERQLTSAQVLQQLRVFKAADAVVNALDLSYNKANVTGYAGAGTSKAPSWRTSAILQADMHTHLQVTNGLPNICRRPLLTCTSTAVATWVLRRMDMARAPISGASSRTFLHVPLLVSRASLPLHMSGGTVKAGSQVQMSQGPQQ